MKLTPAQRKALETLRNAGGKSGGFYRDLGVYGNTLSSLERMGLLESFGDWHPRLEQWRITGAGLAALETKP